jgi:hypothetical protein
MARSTDCQVLDNPPDPSRPRHGSGCYVRACSHGALDREPEAGCCYSRAMASALGLICTYEINSICDCSVAVRLAEVSRVTLYMVLYRTSST